jgi:tRNA(Ile)-lysidine synthetase-like protein
MQEWFDNPDWWFPKLKNIELIDECITNKYTSYLEHESGNLNNLDKIVLYDQIPRHIYRNESANHIILYFLEKALDETFDIITKGLLDSFDDTRFCFILLPLRHTKERNQILKAIELTWLRLSKYYFPSPILSRFLNAAYSRCPIQGLVSCNPSKSNTLIMSLSGGVDSMVCSFVLKSLGYNLRAVHINYNNRISADSEAQFVMKWCDLLGIECFVRKISEISRNECKKHGLRSIYEKYTRDVRYQSYRDAQGTVVVLGHNKDDVVENILTNISHKNRYDDLKGMTVHTIQDGIHFWRPFLEIPKSEIYTIAKNFNIPHLPDSTPEWSNRGKVRRTVMPVIDNWMSGFSNSLIHLSDSLRDLYNALDVDIDFIIKNSNDSVYFIQNLFERSHIFLRAFFNKLQIYPSDKSINNLLQKRKNGFVMLTSNIIIQIDNDSLKIKSI